MTVVVQLLALAAMLALLVSQQTCVLEKPQIHSWCISWGGTAERLCDLVYFLFPASLNCHGVVSRCHPAHTARATPAWQPCTVDNSSDPALLPSYILLVLTYSDSSLDGDGKELYVTYMVSLAFSTYNSCTDPVIFYLVSADFRDKASRVLCCHSNSQDSPDHTKTMCHILHRRQKCSWKLMCSIRGSLITWCTSCQPQDKWGNLLDVKQEISYEWFNIQNSFRTVCAWTKWKVWKLFSCFLHCLSDRD